jgi:quercetin dioxygenase-like cupin family protein
MAARITRAADAPAYSPPLHEDVAAVRLQGHEAGPTRAFWVGRTSYPSGSRALTSATAEETVYVCLGGDLTLTVTAEDGTTSTTLLHAGDSVHLPKGTVRSVVNEADARADLLVVIATPQDGTDAS